MQVQIAKSIQKHTGYTLIEVIIALAIFAILGTISVGLLGRAFDTRARIEKQVEPLTELQLAVTRINRDIAQIVDRGPSSLVGDTHHVEFVRGGMINANLNDAKSTLKRIGLLCENSNSLMRKTWSRLYPLNPNDFKQQALAQDLEQCAFSYLSKNSSWVSEWPITTEHTQEPPPSFPRAIKLNLYLKNSGELTLLFMIPGGNP